MLTYKACMNVFVKWKWICNHFCYHSNITKIWFFDYWYYFSSLTYNPKTKANYFYLQSYIMPFLFDSKQKVALSLVPYSCYNIKSMRTNDQQHYSIQVSDEQTTPLSWNFPVAVKCALATRNFKNYFLIVLSFLFKTVLYCIFLFKI